TSWFVSWCSMLCVCVLWVCVYSVCVYVECVCIGMLSVCVWCVCVCMVCVCVCVCVWCMCFTHCVFTEAVLQRRESVRANMWEHIVREETQKDIHGCLLHIQSICTRTQSNTLERFHGRLTELHAWPSNPSLLLIASCHE